MTNHLRRQTQTAAQTAAPPAPPPPPPPPPPAQPPLVLPRRTVDLRIPAIEKYAYCLCLHVKPATIFIAIFKLVRSLLLASILLNSEFAYNDHTDMTGLDEKHKSTIIAVSIFSRVIIASVAALAIYAVMYNRAALLMPLYAVLLVDFFFALPVAYNREGDNPAISPGVEEFKGLTRENHLPRYSYVLFSTFGMIARIYFLCVIWKCYRYLRLIELIEPIRFTDVYPHMAHNIQYPIVRVLGSADSTDLGPGCGGALAPPSYDSVASSMKPPNYEEAIKSDANLYQTHDEQHTVVEISNPISSPTPTDQISQHQEEQPDSNILTCFTNPSLTTSEPQVQDQQEQQQHQQLPSSQIQPQPQRIPSNQIVPTTDPDTEYVRLPIPQRLSQEQHERKNNDQ